MKKTRKRQTSEPKLNNKAQQSLMISEQLEYESIAANIGQPKSARLADVTYCKTTN